MATSDEIERRVEETDAATSTKRSAAAKQVGDLAQRRADVAKQLADLERELGDVLAEFSDVISTDELAKFTDVPVADLNQWLSGRKVTRQKRRRSASPATSGATSAAPKLVEPVADSRAPAGLKISAS